MLLIKGLSTGLILGNNSNSLPNKPLPIDVFKEERYFISSKDKDPLFL